jgi:hypothetical protein
VLSWSLLTRCTAAAPCWLSDTAPCASSIRPGKPASLRNFFDVDGFAATALQVLADRRPTATSTRPARTIQEHYSLQSIIRA